MRILDAIQGDIIFLTNQNGNFIDKLFNSTSLRISDLRLEEFKVLDSMLLESNYDYKSIAEENLSFLKNTNWNMKVTEYTHGARNLGFTTEIIGKIETKGYAYGKRGTGYSLFSKNSSLYVGRIDHLGHIDVQAHDSGIDSFVVPKTLKCFTNEFGELKIEKDEQEASLTYDTHIKSVMGDPFNKNEIKRNAFIKGRNLLIKIISKHKV